MLLSNHLRLLTSSILFSFHHLTISCFIYLFIPIKVSNIIIENSIKWKSMRVSSSQKNNKLLIPTLCLYICLYLLDLHNLRKSWYWWQIPQKTMNRGPISEGGFNIWGSFIRIPRKLLSFLQLYKIPYCIHWRIQ